MYLTRLFAHCVCAQFKVVITKYFGSMKETMEKIVACHKEKTGRDTLTPQDGLLIRSEYGSTADNIASAVLKEHGLDSDGLQLLLEVRAMRVERTSQVIVSRSGDLRSKNMGLTRPFSPFLVLLATLVAGFQGGPGD